MKIILHILVLENKIMLGYFMGKVFINISKYNNNIHIYKSSIQNADSLPQVESIVNLPCYNLN